MHTKPIPPRYVRTWEAARFLGVSSRTLEKHRASGTGPTFRKLGAIVVYAIGDLQAWADRGRRQSTTDSHPDQINPPHSVARDAHA